MLGAAASAPPCSSRRFWKTRSTYSFNSLCATAVAPVLLLRASFINTHFYLNERQKKKSVYIKRRGEYVRSAKPLGGLGVLHVVRWFAAP